MFASQAKQVFYINDPKYGNNWKVVQVVQNKRVWDMPEVEEQENDQVELLKVVNVIPCTIDISPEDINLCRDDVDPIVIEEQIIQQVDDDFINDEEEDVHLSSNRSLSLDEHLDSE